MMFFLKEGIDILQTLFKVLKKRLFVFLFFFFVLFTLFFLFQNYGKVLDIFSFNLDPISKISLLFLTLFDINNTFSKFSFAVVFFGSFFGALSSLMTYTYFRERTQILQRSNLFHGFGFVLIVIGTSCAVCNVAILSFFATLGITGLLAWLPYQGQELGFIGILALIITTIHGTYQVRRAGVC